jgi:transposase-like protein
MAVAQHKEIKHAIQTTYKRKGYGAPKVIVTDRLKSYRAAMKVIGN